MARITRYSTRRKTDVTILPHGLSVQRSTIVQQESVQDLNAAKAARKSSSGSDSTSSPPEIAVSITAEANIVRKQKAAPTQLGITPFPDYLRPTAEECKTIYDLLTKEHGEIKAPETPEMPSASVAGCGNVPFILEAVIRTVISAHTSMRNANLAIKGLLVAFPAITTGPYAGSTDWNRVRRADKDRLLKAIKCGGLGLVKTKFIHSILNDVWEENEAKRAELRAPLRPNESTTGPPNSIMNEATAEEKRASIMTNMAIKALIEQPEVLTLDYMHSWSAQDAFSRLTRFMGVAEKTAACVLLFCMQRPLFAVDTHVWRLCNWLGWVPHAVDRIKTFAHCDVRVPDEFKFGLHQLMIAHGKDCDRCKSNTVIKDKTPPCVLEEFLTRIKKVHGSKKRAASGDDLEEPTDGEGKPPANRSKKRKTTRKSLAKSKNTPSKKSKKRATTRKSSLKIRKITLTIGAAKVVLSIEPEGDNEEEPEDDAHLPPPSADLQDFDWSLIDDDEEESKDGDELSDDDASEYDSNG